MSPPISDAAQRLAAIDPTDSFIVQAPAGSGKTELLIQRFLALLGRVNRPEEILAITFTRKAAGEMRARLLQALEHAQTSRPEAAHAAQTWDLASRALAQDRQQGWNLLDNPALLAIQTIDSFDAGLVRRMPWISRFGGPTAIAEDPELLYRQAAEGLLSRLGGNNPGGAEVALLLEHLDNRLDLLCNLLMSLLARRDQWLRHVIWNDPEAERLALQGALRYLVEAQLARLFEAVPAELRQQLIGQGRFAANNLAEDEQRPLRRLREAQAFPNPVADDLPLWLGLADLLLTAAGSWRKKLDKNCGFPAGKEGEAPARKQAMSALLDTLRDYPAAETLLAEVRALPEAVYPEEQWRILRALVELLPLAVAELWLVFREQGSADFAEIALKALEALGSEQQPSELLLKLDACINHILVDEFQDTSYLQNGLLEKLT
ncbi:MAG: UvrD-helicase domain-containing protein, partial [Trichloromonadaceae bacterium]